MNKLFFTFCLLPQLLCAQDKIEFRQQLNDTQSGWYSFEVPKEAVNSGNENNFRIYHYQKDTVRYEAPYLLHRSMPRTSKTSNKASILNTGILAGDRYSTTLKLDKAANINQIHLTLTNNNFDSRITLQGSMDQGQWTTLVDNYRLVAINNQNTSYAYTDIHFPPSNFLYYRILWPDEDNPGLVEASYGFQGGITGEYYEPHQLQTRTLDDDGNISILLEFEERVPVSRICLQISDELDYYRPFSIIDLSDSSETTQGRMPRYHTIYTGTLSSLESSCFTFGEKRLKAAEIQIYNGDNSPLEITGISATTYKRSLSVRFENAEKYVFSYGNLHRRPPNYDLSHFASSIPADIPAVSPGPVDRVIIEDIGNGPLFERDWWLWAVIVLLIAVFGYATVKMMIKSPSEPKT